MRKKQRIVVTGIGPISSLGIGRSETWRGLLKGDVGLELVTNKYGNYEFAKFYLHKIRNFNLNDFKLDANVLNYINAWKQGNVSYDLLVMLAATKLAIHDAKLDYRKVQDSLALVVAHENICLEDLLKETFDFVYYDKAFDNMRLKRLYNKIVRTAYETQTFMLLFHIARVFGIHKYSLCVNNACASGLYALEVASDMIKLGKASRVIVVAGDCPNVFKYLWFKNLGMYKDDGKIEPFSKNSYGLVMGEGAAALILEDYTVAMKRHARIYGEYIGSGFRLESWKVTVPNISENYLQYAIEEALTNSKIKAANVDLICAHGVGTQLSDKYEATAIKEIFAKWNVPVVCFKPYIGHNLGGSSLIEVALLMLCLQNDFVPPILNTHNEMGRMDINLVTQRINSKLSIVLKICCAFAGYSAATIFRKIE